MSIPDYETLMLPVLKYLGDGKEHRITEVAEAMAEEFDLTADERTRLIPSGQSTCIRNRTGWARTYLKKAGLVEYPRRAYLLITDLSRRVLQDGPDRIDRRFLEQFPSFAKFIKLRRSRHDERPKPELDVRQTPEEALDSAYQRLRSGIEAELLDLVKAASPGFFERLVIRLLVAMGYGGSLRDAGQAVGRSGDGGIDGIIKEDRLGLDAIYIQAKRWDNSVGRPEVQKFVGALQGHFARKGVFITTAGFTRDAVEFVKNIEANIVLIDGSTMAGLMVDYNVGVSQVGTYDVKKIDADFFDEE